MAEICPAYMEVSGTMRLFRNAVFHIQPEFWTPKLMDVLKDEPVVEKIRSVHHDVGTYLQTAASRQNSTPTDT